MIDLPAYIDKEAWAGFVEMRKLKKWPLTERATMLILRTLEGIHARGGDPNAALDQSTERCYRGVFEVKQFGGGFGNLSDGKTGKNLAILEASLRREQYQSGDSEDGHVPPGSDRQRGSVGIVRTGDCRSRSPRLPSRNVRTV